MSRRLTVHPAATEELREQARYLNVEERGLGARFLRVANSAIEEARRVPRLGQLIESDDWPDEELRRRSVLPFKCHVVYVVDEMLSPWWQSPTTRDSRSTGPTASPGRRRRP